MNDEKLLDISWASIFKISITVLILYTIFLIRDILIWFLFALIISILFNPAVDLLQRKRIPRVLAASFLYVVVFGLLTLFLYIMASFFFNEIQTFSESFPKYFEQLSPFLRGVGVQAFADTETFLRMTGEAVGQIATNIFNTLFIVFGGMFSALFVISVAFFLSIEEKAVEKSLSMLFPPRYEATIFQLWGRAQKRVSGWFVSRLLACLFVGLVSFFVLFLFNIKYPVSLAMIAGILNFIPFVGPFFTGILLFLVVALDSLPMAILVIIAFTLIQQVESNVLTPFLSKRFVGMSPALVLLALAIGGKLWGLLGAILVVPLTGILAEFLYDFIQRQRE